MANVYWLIVSVLFLVFLQNRPRGISTRARTNVVLIPLRCRIHSESCSNDYMVTTIPEKNGKRMLYKSHIIMVVENSPSDVLRDTCSFFFFFITYATLLQFIPSR